jgi:hypothetical protein
VVRAARVASILAAATLVLGCSSDSTPDEAGETTAPAGTSSEASTTSEASPGTAAPADGLWLLEDGLGLFAFGEPDQSAMPRLIDALGQPTADTTFTADMPDGIGGPDTTVRLVDFGSLSVTFTDWPYFRDDGAMHFVRWILFQGSGPPGLATSEGISLGSTVDDLRAAYGERLVLPEAPDDCTGQWLFSVGGSALGLQGALDGPSTDGSSSVIVLTAGAQSSC